MYSARAQILSRAGRLEEARAAAQVERDVADQLDRLDRAGAADYDLATIALAMERWDEAAAALKAALFTTGAA